MKNNKSFLLLLLILPWLTIPLLGKDALKKYLPSAIFIDTFTKAIDILGEKKKWWKFYKGIPPLNSMNFFNFGPYIVISLWILKLTYGKFRLYLTTNIILHILFIYGGGLKLVQRYKILSLKKLPRFQYFALDFLRAILLYSFQFIDDLKNNVH